MANGNFCVVEFKDSQDLASVPSSWVSEELCQIVCSWPSGPNRRGRKLAKMAANVDTSWRKYPCEILHTFDTYEAAKKKERFLESFWDFDESQERRQRSKKRQRKNYSSSEDEEPAFPPAPLISKVTRSSSAVGLPDVSSSINPDERQEENSPDQISNDANIVERLEHLEQCCFKIQSDVSEILSLLQAQGSNATLAHLDVVENYLPLSNLPAVYELETHLADSLQRREEMRLHLQRLGGSSTDEMVKRILRHIFTDDLAQHFSWLGQKGKHKLCDLFVTKVIFHAVETSRIPGSRERIENRIREWFRQAGTRSKYLTERQLVP